MTSRTGIALAALLSAGCETAEPASLDRGISVEVPLPAHTAGSLPSPDARCEVARSALVPEGPAVGSTVALARLAGDKRVALVADQDAREIRMVDLDAQRELSALTLHGRPGQLLIQPDGRVVVTLSDRGRIVVLAAQDETLAAVCARSVASEPVGLADRGDGGVVVTSRWARRVTVFDAALERVAELPVARDPHGVAVVGTTAYVSHVVGGSASIVDLGSLEVRRAPLERRERIGNDDDDPSFVRRRGAQGYAAIPTGEGVEIPLMMTDPGDARVAVDITGYGGGTIAPITTGLIARFGRNATRADFPSGRRRDDMECPLPRAAAWAHARAELLVACQGTDRVIAYHRGRDALNEQRASFSVPSGPTGIAVDDARAVVWSQFAQKLTVHALDLFDDTPTVEIALERRGAPDAQVALGRALFHAAGQKRISFDGRSCASCHPDGRDDGMTWATDEGPRQTPILMGRLDGSAPYGWNGDMPTLEAHLRRTLRRLGGTGLTARERDALVAYIHSLEAPEVTNADQRVARGAEIFGSPEAGCSGCHVDVIGTDRINHDVGTLAPGDDIREFDTPSLRFVGQSAPYFHDGRYPTLLAMLRDQHMKMGQTDHLGRDDLDALAAFLETL